MKTFTSILLFIAVTASVLAVPATPILFFGDVTVNGNVPQDGLLITAQIDGADVEATTTDDGRYSLKIGDPFGDREGETISFFIQGINTGTTAEWNYDDGAVINLDLSVSGTICGDNACSSGESCSSCSADCGTCDVPAPTTTSLGGGGGGGGGAFPLDDVESGGSGCQSDWVCSDWLDCANGFQKRVCVDANRCGVDDGPGEQQDCTIPVALRSEESLSRSAADGDMDALLAQEENNGNLLTGAFIGGGVQPWMGLVFFLLIIGGIAFFYMRYK